MTARPLKPHGTTARAQGRRSSGIPSCHCEPCVAALRRYNNRRHALTALGRPGRVLAKRAAAKLRALADAGLTWNQIKDATGISQGTIHNLLAPGGEHRTITSSTESRILSASVSGLRGPGGSRVDGTGTRRRLQALARIGWTCEALSEHTTLDRSRLGKAMRAQRVEVRTRARVAELFARLECTPGPSMGAARRAELKGWAPPAAWDPETIDNPAALPELGERSPRPLAVLEDVEFIRRTTGVTDRDLIAKRLEITRKALDANLARARRMNRDLVAA